MVKKAMLLAAMVVVAAAFAAPAAQASQWEVNYETLGSEKVPFTAKGDIHTTLWRGESLEIEPCKEEMTGNIWNENEEARGEITGYVLTPACNWARYGGPAIIGQFAFGHDNEHGSCLLSESCAWPLQINGDEVHIENYEIVYKTTIPADEYARVFGTASLVWNGSGFEFNEDESSEGLWFLYYGYSWNTGSLQFLAPEGLVSL
jgi:hypothetical protein